MENKRPLSILRYNAEKMRDNGAPQEYIAKYLADNGSNFQQIMSIESPNQEILNQDIELERSGKWKKQQEMSDMGSLVGGTAKAVAGGLTYGLADEIRAGAKAISETALKGGFNRSEKPFAEQIKERTNLINTEYDKAFEEEQANMERFAEKHPVLSTVGAVAGAMANPLGSVGMAGKGASLGTKVVRGALTSGVQGGLYGLGEGEGNLANRLSNALDYAKTGAVIGGGLPIAGWGLKKAGGLAGDILGFTTGTGKSVQQAYKAGQVGDDAFLENMRGKKSFQTVVDDAKSAARKIKTDAQNRYNKAMSNLPEEKISLSQLKEQIKEWRAENVLGKGVVSESVDDFLNEASKKLDDFTAGAVDDMLSVRDADKVKRAIWDIATREGSAGEQLKTTLYGSLKKEIAEKAPIYNSIMKDYSSVAETLKEISKTFSLGGRSNKDTAVRKLQSLMRDNVATNYGNRLKLADYLEKFGGANIRNSVAGQSLSSVLPRGLVSQGLAGIQGLSLATNPAKLLSLALMSPRAVGESAYALGKLATQAGKVTARIPKSAAVYTPLAKALGGI